MHRLRRLLIRKNYNLYYEEVSTLKPKINVVNVLQIVGYVLSIGGTLVLGAATDKKNKEHLANFVKEELSKTQK